MLALYMMTQTPPGTAAGTNTPAPDAPLSLTENAPPVQISSLHGKVVVLDFWATWCGPCRQSMPELEKLYQKYKAQGVIVVGVSADEASSQEQIPQVKQALGITYPTVIGMKTPELLKSYDSGSLPTLYVIDKRGNVRYNEAGFDPGRGLSKADALVGALLKE